MFVCMSNVQETETAAEKKKNAKKTRTSWSAFCRTSFIFFSVDKPLLFRPSDLALLVHDGRRFLSRWKTETYHQSLKQRTWRCSGTLLSCVSLESSVKKQRRYIKQQTGSMPEKKQRRYQWRRTSSMRDACKATLREMDAHKRNTIIWNSLKGKTEELFSELPSNISTLLGSEQGVFTFR